MNSGGQSLQFDQIISLIREGLAGLPDKRGGTNTHYTIEDIALSAFSVFFMQSPSFLDFQRQMGRSKGRHNAASLFGVQEVPSDNQIRSVLDGAPAAKLYGLFDRITEEVQRRGLLDQFRSVGGDLLVTLDGTEYYRSSRISCPHCHERTKADGQKEYYHRLITPAIVKAGRKDVLALAPEFIGGGDGESKAEGEHTAAKRWLRRMGDRLSPLSVTIMGDDLYAHQPFLAMVREYEMNFLCICKPNSHKYLFECIDSHRRGGELDSLERREWTGKEYRTSRYEWIEDVPLRDSEDALNVGWISVLVSGEDGRQIYRNSFITNHPISEQTVAGLVEAGRARWKIENEDINTLKTRGYHLEHNFGHGNTHLCETLATLNILAFLLHTLLDLYDKRYRLLRTERGRRTRFFQELGTLVCYWYFESWPELMRFMIRQLELSDPGG